MLQSNPGTYVLIFKASSAKNIRVGATGLRHFDPGYYLYVGSAFGPGGIRARVGRHRKRRKSKRWHIDYLMAHFKPYAAVISYDEKRWEHDWAAALSEMNYYAPISKFGDSDCNCGSHLFLSKGKPDQVALASRLDGNIELIFWG